jgi:hypothetical protein
VSPLFTMRARQKDADGRDVTWQADENGILRTVRKASK